LILDEGHDVVSVIYSQGFKKMNYLLVYGN